LPIGHRSSINVSAIPAPAPANTKIQSRCFTLKKNIKTARINPKNRASAYFILAEAWPPLPPTTKMTVETTLLKLNIF